jgi:hypothetical protein
MRAGKIKITRPYNTDQIPVKGTSRYPFEIQLLSHGFDPEPGN